MSQKSSFARNLVRKCLFFLQNSAVYDAVHRAKNTAIYCDMETKNNPQSALRFMSSETLRLFPELCLVH